MQNNIVFLNEVYVTLGETSLGWMNYLEYRKKLETRQLSSDVEYHKVNVSIIDENGCKRDVDMFTKDAFAEHPLMMFSTISMKYEQLIDVYTKLGVI